MQIKSESIETIVEQQVEGDSQIYILAGAIAITFGIRHCSDERKSQNN